MLATIIREEFIWDDREAVAEALDDVCSPNDNYGWASAGVYAFWDPSGPSLLYIGLASDVAQRFRQHVGLLPSRAAACKLARIQAHFTGSSTLGYSVLVQSPMSQPVVSRTTLPEGDDAEFPTDGVGAIKFSEGLLISGYHQRHDELPPWNEIEGSREGQERARPEHCFLLDLLCGIGDDTMVARRFLRELSKNPTACGFEEFLHGARQLSTFGGFLKAYAFVPENEISSKQRIEEGYWPMSGMAAVEEASAQRFRRDYAGHSAPNE